MNPTLFFLLDKIKRRWLYTERQYISEVIDAKEFLKDRFNLISSGCGTGKSKFISKTLLSQLPWIKPYEVLLVTSRSLTVAQQSKQEDILNKFDRNDKTIVNYWNADDDGIDQVIGRGIQVMTYDKIIDIILKHNSDSGTTLEKTKIVVFDECHAMFSDKFIRGMESLRVWIRGALSVGNKYIIGLTATPQIMNFYGTAEGFNINNVNTSVLRGYVAKQMIATTFDGIIYLITSGKLPGKTLVMCPTVDECFTLRDAIPNSAVLISPNNKRYTPEMDSIRKTIVDDGLLPENYLIPTTNDDGGKPIRYERKTLKVLITTSTAREGFNLNKESGVKNIVCCFGDSLHITQFAGRARYDLDNIVVADTYIPMDKFNPNDYLPSQRRKFKEFLWSNDNVRWFNTVAHLVEHDAYSVQRVIVTKNEGRFITYINSKWLVPSEASKEEIEKHKIWRKQDKDEIVNMANICNIIDEQKRFVTFNKVITTMTRCFGYEIDSGRQIFNNERRTYKLIVSFDEEKLNTGNMNRQVNESNLDFTWKDREV